MFQHKGNNRSLKQNLGIASLLSFVAGLVNVVGFLSVQKLTTNVTGHFANLVGEALNLDLYQAFFYFLYILSFLLGAFFSNFIIEISNKIKGKSNFIIPILFEVCILLLISIQSFDWISDSPNAIACGLLFAMGLQNALVTAISNSVVRTTHLTGLFTDLGIELSQLFFFQIKRTASGIVFIHQIALNHYFILLYRRNPCRNCVFLSANANIAHWRCRIDFRAEHRLYEWQIEY